MIPDLKLVIFDLDGVLTETSRQHFKAWRALAAKHDIELDDAFEVHLKGISRQASLEKILSLTSRSYSVAEKVAMQAEKNAHYQSLIADFSAEDCFDGVQALLDLLQKKGIYIALASASKNGPKLIKSLGIADYFDYIADPTRHPSKPAPDLFLAPMHHYGLTAHQCLGVEDAVAGIRAIKAAGMKAIGIGKPGSLPEADVQYATLADFTEAMRAFFQ
ncbi:MAG: beta-phosphoglucomutase [Acholeplasmatales bacterium]|nr:MAG: beta-phosphoglucomutase [Acholeplasmatales bacterium]